MAERNAGLPEENRIAFRMGINLGDVVSPSSAFASLRSAVSKRYMKVGSFLKQAVGGYGSGTKIDVVAEQRYAIRTNDGIGSTHVQINMRVVVGHRCARASEFLHADLYVR